MPRKIIVSALLGLLLGALCACGGSGSSGNNQPPPPSIQLSTLVPDYAVAGSGQISLGVTGSGFTASSVVEWNGTPLTTSFGTSQILTASISSALMSQPGAATITVVDGGAKSNALSFGIASPAAATAGVISMITVAPDGTPADNDSLVKPSISATGRYVAFQSAATNLAPGPTSGFQEIYERDTCIGAPPGCTPSTIRVSVTYDGSAVNNHSRDSAISADGRYVAFDSSATNILPNSSVCDPNAGVGFSCVFIRDTCIGAPSACVPSSTAVSVATDASIQPGEEPAISADGRFVAFDSGASNLTPVGTSNGVDNVFVRDTCNGVSGCTPGTTLISVSSSGAQGNALSAGQALSVGNRFASFGSYATNLVPNDTNAQQGDYFWRDTCLGAPSSCVPSTIRVDVSNTGAQANGHIFDFSPSISADGRIVGFSTHATNLVAQDVGGFINVYVHDTCTGATGCTPATNLVSVANDGSIANQGSADEEMTPDGRFFAFDSLATNLVPGDTFPAGSFKDVFVRDTCYGASSGCAPSTVRVSVTSVPNPETPGNNVSTLPAISADGHYVVFLSSATNFTSPPGNGHQMVYLARTGF